MRTEAEKKTMIAAIMHERENSPRRGLLGAQNHNRADTLVGIINGIITEERVDDLENDDELSDMDAITCREAFRWLQNDESVKLVADEDLQAVALKEVAAYEDNTKDSSQEDAD